MGEPHGGTSEVEGAADETVDPADGSYLLIVREVLRETEDACSIVFETPDRDPDRWAYRPGQFLTLQVPHPDGALARCYSLCSAPDIDDHLRIGVKRIAGGRASTWITESLRAGDTVQCLPPAGMFTPKSLDADLLLLAAGSGITPMLSIVRTALAKGSGQVVLLYANQHEGAVIFARELGALVAEHPERVHVVHWLESVQGLPTREQLARLCAPHAAYEAMLCGPSPFMETATRALVDNGMPRSRIHIEKFRSLSDNPFALAERPAPDELVDDEGEPARVEVSLDGETHEFDWPRNQKLLDLLLDRGLKAPYSCRLGQCSACACVLDEGEVRMINNEILEQEDLDEGYVLGCQSVPVTDRVRVHYD